ncbi:MAG: hypothetical protein AAF623_21985, partial [Planctomycetota bacterium]
MKKQQLIPLALLFATFVCLPGDHVDAQDVIRPAEDRAPAVPFVSPQDNVSGGDRDNRIDPRYAGWQEASLGTGKARLSNQLRR